MGDIKRIEKFVLASRRVQGTISASLAMALPMILGGLGVDLDSKALLGLSGEVFEGLAQAVLAVLGLIRLLQSANKPDGAKLRLSTPAGAKAIAFLALIPFLGGCAGGVKLMEYDTGRFTFIDVQLAGGAAQWSECPVDENGAVINDERCRTATAGGATEGDAGFAGAVLGPIVGLVKFFLPSGLTGGGAVSGGGAQ